MMGWECSANTTTSKQEDRFFGDVVVLCVVLISTKKENSVVLGEACGWRSDMRFLKKKNIFESK